MLNYLTTLLIHAPAARARNSRDQSLLSFGHGLGYLPINVGKVVKAPAVKNTLAERIINEADTTRLIALEPSFQNRALLTLTYGGGLRVSRYARCVGGISRPAMVPGK